MGGELRLTDLKGVPLAARQATTPIIQTADGVMEALRAFRDGSLVTADWLLARALEGKAFTVNSGTLTTPTTFNATIAAAEPDLLLGVPAGTIVIPVSISIGFEDTGTAQVLDVLAMASNVLDVAVTGTALTPYNNRTDAPRTSRCTAYGVVTANGTDPYSGHFFEFWRPFAGFGEDAFNGSTGWVNQSVHGAKWSIKEAACPPVIVGAGSINIYAAAQAGTGFITLQYIEIDKAEVI